MAHRSCFRCGEAETPGWLLLAATGGLVPCPYCHPGRAVAWMAEAQPVLRDLDAATRDALERAVFPLTNRMEEVQRKLRDSTRRAAAVLDGTDVFARMATCEPRATPPPAPESAPATTSSEPESPTPIGGACAPVETERAAAEEKR